MRLLQFSTSHYCRKARLALGYKQIPYEVENLVPGFHTFRIKPLTGLTTTPVLLPERADQPQAVGDSTRIFHYLETLQPDPPLCPPHPRQHSEAWMLEDWLDESIGTATRFVYYQFRVAEGRSVDPSWSSLLVIQSVRHLYGITAASAELAAQRLDQALQELSYRWSNQAFLVGDCLSVADLAAAALLSPLALIPAYRHQAPWLFERIAQIHDLCGEPPPAGLAELA
jgi:glutathione S-transferase